MSREVVKKLKSLRRTEVNPRAEWVRANREILLSQVRNTRTSPEDGAFNERFWSGMSVFIPQRVVFSVVRPLAILLIVAVVGTSGWITAVDASYEALPGDWLYPAKRAVEKTQIATASLLGDNTSRAQLHAEFATRRASEIKKVVKLDASDKQVKVAATLNDLKEEISHISDSLEGVKEEKSGSGGTVEMIKEVQKNTEKIKGDLKEAKDDLAAEESAESLGLAKEVLEVKSMNKAIEMKVVELVVAKHLEDNTIVTKKDVEEVVATTLKNSQNEVQQVKNEVTVMSGIIEEAKSTSATSTAAVVSSTPDARLDTPSSQAKQAVEKTTTASAEVDKKVEEMKEILQTGSMNAILDKVKEVVEITRESDTTSAETMIAVREAAPLRVVETLVPVAATGTVDIAVTSTPANPATTTGSTP